MMLKMNASASTEDRLDGFHRHQKDKITSVLKINRFGSVVTALLFNISCSIAIKFL